MILKWCKFYALLYLLRTPSHDGLRNIGHEGMKKAMVNTAVTCAERDSCGRDLSPSFYPLLSVPNLEPRWIPRDLTCIAILFPGSWVRVCVLSIPCVSNGTQKHQAHYTPIIVIHPLSNHPAYLAPWIPPNIGRPINRAILSPFCSSDPASDAVEIRPPPVPLP